MIVDMETHYRPARDGAASAVERRWSEDGQFHYSRGNSAADVDRHLPCLFNPRTGIAADVRVRLSEPVAVHRGGPVEDDGEVHVVAVARQGGQRRLQVGHFG